MNVWVIRNGRWSILLFILGKLIIFLKWMDIFFSELIACSINALQSKNIQLKNHDWIFTISGLCLFKMCAFLVLQKKVFYCRIYSVCCNTYVAVNPQKIEKRNCGISRKNKSYSKWIFSYLIFFRSSIFLLKFRSYQIWYWYTIIMQFTPTFLYTNFEKEKPLFFLRVIEILPLCIAAGEKEERSNDT